MCIRDRFWVPLGNDQYKTMSWVNRGSIVDMKKKTISMRFNPDIWKDIAQLTSNYTSYSIEYLLMMQSTYSMRVYEIILSYDNGNRDYSYNNGLIFEPVTEEMCIRDRHRTSRDCQRSRRRLGLWR